MEPDDDSNNIFWDEGGSEMGTIDELTIYKDEKSRNIDLTDYSWHHDLVEWHEFYQRNIHDGYKNINNTEWLNGGRKAGDLPKKYENFSLKTLRWITDIAVSRFRFYTVKI